MALSSVVLPEPLVPTMMTNEPGSSVMLTLRSARTSFGVPAKNVLEMFSMLSISTGRNWFALKFAQEIRQHQSRENKSRSDQFQVVRIQAPTQGNGHQQPEQNRSHD